MSMIQPDKKDNAMQRLQNERCPLCFEVTLGMVCWPKCLHKICLACGYRMVRTTKPHGSLTFDGLGLDVHLSYAQSNILCPLCRVDQTSAFPPNEAKLMSAFSVPNNDWKVAMAQRVQDVMDLPTFSFSAQIKCTKCSLFFPSMEMCLAHISRCSENNIFCPFCHVVLPPGMEEKNLTTRVLAHVKYHCPYKIRCNFSDCKAKVAISKMCKHRKVHAELLLLGEFLAGGQHQFQSLSEAQEYLKGAKWEKIQKQIQVSLKSSKNILEPQLITSAYDQSLEVLEVKNGILPIRLEEEDQQENDAEEDEEEEEDDSPMNDHTMIFITE